MGDRRGGRGGNEDCIGGCGKALDGEERERECTHDYYEQNMDPKHGMEANCIEKKRVFLPIQPLERQIKEHVMDSQSWHFDGHTLVLIDITDERKPSEIPLHATPFWVRVYDLQFVGRTNEANAKTIGNKIGTFIAVDKTHVIGINKSLRVKTMIDLRKPIMKEVNLKMRGGVTKKFPNQVRKVAFVLLYMWMSRSWGERLWGSNSLCQSKENVQ